LKNPNRRQGGIFSSPKNSVGGLTFQEAFPDIETVHAEVHETGEGNHGLGLRRITKNSLREFVNCSNPTCAGQGLAIGQIIQQMAASREAKRSLHERCQSHEESGRRCPNYFEGFIELTYRSS
jgi:hypothetical protein